MYTLLFATPNLILSLYVVSVIPYFILSIILSIVLHFPYTFYKSYAIYVYSFNFYYLALTLPSSPSNQDFGSCYSSTHIL